MAFNVTLITLALENFKPPSMQGQQPQHLKSFQMTNYKIKESKYTMAKHQSFKHVNLSKIELQKNQSYMEC